MEIIDTYLNDVLVLKTIEQISDGISEFSINDVQMRDFGIDPNFVQENQSFSFKHVLRGLHFQEVNPQGKLIRVIKGSVFDVFVDLRRSSPSFGRYASCILSSDKSELLWIPPGYAHGFLSLEDSKVIYRVTQYRDVESERTLLWNDQFLNIPWPVLDTELIISEKDKNGLSWDNINYFD